jgi:hypothetical protein
MAWLEKMLGPSDFEELVGELFAKAIGSHNVIEPKVQQIMLDFQTIKHEFKGLGEPAEGFIGLPWPLSTLDDPARSIVNGEIRISE